MTAEIGSLFLHLAGAFSIVIMLARLFHLKIIQLRVLWAITFSLLAGSLLCLIYCYMISDFSVLNVVNNSHVTKPLLFKISAAWGNHEGSMLLWLSAIAFFSLLFSIFNHDDPQDQPIIIATLSIQGLIILLFVIYVLSISNPFLRIFPAPLSGQGFNPILQDVGLALHPPMLYLGYVGFSIPFSMAIAALLLKKFERRSTMIMQPWTLLSWSFLSLGIGLGSWWAYRELGWGGYWFWDPVENSSLMPWLAATALLHALSANAKSDKLYGWSLFLSIYTFSLSMLGTFLVRSGIVTSVHSFAQDPTRGIYILSIIGLITGAGLLLFTLRAHLMIKKDKFFSTSLESFITLNNIIFSLASAIVVLGTLYPILLHVVTKKFITVGTPYYIKILSPLALVILSLLISLPNAIWNRKAKFAFSYKKLILPIFILSFSLALFWLKNKFTINDLCTKEFLAINLSSWLIAASMKQFISVNKKISSGFYNMVAAHLGFACIIFGISICSAFEDEVEKSIAPQTQFTLGSHQIKFNGITYERESDYLKRTGIFKISKAGGPTHYLYPETRMYPVEQQQTTETAIFHHLLYDFYLTIGDIELDRITVKAMYRPGISFIWFGTLLIFLGGFFASILKLWCKRSIASCIK